MKLSQGIVFAGCVRLQQFPPLCYAGGVTEAEYIRRIYPGACVLCWWPLAEDWQRLRAKSGRVPWGALRKLGISKYVSYRHAHHGPNHTRSRLTFENIRAWQQNSKEIRRFQFRPGECGNPNGRPRGARDKRKRRPPSGIAETIRAERQDRAARLRLAQLAALKE
jgi:hypothetical protein